MRRIVSVWLIDWPVTVWRRSATRARRPASPPDPALDPQNPFALILKNSRGAAVIHALNLSGRVVMVGDGWNDAEVKLAGGADAFYAFTEVARRPSVIEVADATAISLCQDNDLPIVVFNLLVEGNIARAVRGETIGTLVSTDN